MEIKNTLSPDSTVFVPDNIEPRDSSFDVEQSSELPFGIPDTELSETEDSTWNEVPYNEEEAQPTLPPMLPVASVMYHGAIIMHPHKWIKHLHTVRSEFKKQIKICDHGTVGSFHLLTLTWNWVRTVLLEKYKYSFTSEVKWAIVQ